MVSITELLQKAQSLNASDIHLTVGIPPKCRINGELQDIGYHKLQPSDLLRFIESLLIDHTKKVLEEMGEVDSSYSIPGFGRFRVNVFKQRGSYAVVMRLVGSSIPKPEVLGIPSSVVELTKKKRGLILVTGPTGSGKSTTLASLINEINSNYNSHIITLEDPIEYLHAHKKSIVNQREITTDTRSYSNALRAALREDPDVILVGEMRDLDTISIAVTAAETGHLVLSTLHTTGAANTIDRIVDVFPPHQQQQIKVQLASVLEATISQQLIPTLEGKSRVAAFEVMHATPAIKNLIREGKTHQISSIIQTNKKGGMQTMDDAIFDLYMKQMISEEQAINFAQDTVAITRRFI